MALTVSSESSGVKPASGMTNWQDLPLLNSPSNEKLAQMQLYLDVLFLALVALTDLEITTVQTAIRELDLRHLSLDPALSGNLSHPKHWRSSLAHVLTLEEARSLVLLICHLAQKNQELLRRAITLMEQMQEQGKDASKTVLLGNYLDSFQELYRGYRHTDTWVDPLDWQYFGFKQLIDLLFYGAKNGYRRLWLVLIESV